MSLNDCENQVCSMILKGTCISEDFFLEFRMKTVVKKGSGNWTNKLIMLEKERNLLRGKIKISKTSLDKYKREKKISIMALLMGLVKTEVIFFFQIGKWRWLEPKGD